MKITTITIGEYQISPSVPFCLYQFPTRQLVTPPYKQQSEEEKEETVENYFCIEDLFSIFDLHLIQQDLISSFSHYPASFLKSQSNSFLLTSIVAEIALKHNLFNLVDICRLNHQDILLGSAIPLLKLTTFVRLHTKPKISTIDLEARPLDGNEWFFSRQEPPKIKLEPFSPTTSLSPSPPTSLLLKRPHHQSKRHLSSIASSSSSSSIFLSPPATIIMYQQQKETTTVLESPIKLPKPSSLLLKRLAPKHGHKKNLTILTPSYNEDSPHAIQSAPLRRPTTTTTTPLHIPVLTNKGGKVNKKPSPPTTTLLKKRLFNNIPATASAISAPWPQTSTRTRFPSPPIVPSQQPAWAQQYRTQQKTATLKTATTPYFPPSTAQATTTTPHTPAAIRKTSPQPHTLTQKQKFLQPFEYLYDHIEQTRVLKTTLDDQIRRSSSLMQTLQSSGTMVESLVRRQVRDMMDEQFEAKLRDCTERIYRLENQFQLKKEAIPISPAISPSPTREDKSTLLAEPQEVVVVKDLITQLMNRIDQLESKLV